MSRVAILGAWGFVGSHVAAEAERLGHTVTRLHAPRLTSGAEAEEAARDLSASLAGHDVVVNCAGIPDASSSDSVGLDVANGVLPGVVGAAARLAGIPRYVHVSSAVVQGRRSVLDSTEDVDPFSPYARSKVHGEQSARALGPEATVVYRPPSVHAWDRRVTRQLARIARSPLSSVAAPGDDPTPQTHISDVASAVAFLATSPTPPPQVVHHPWQGHTTAGLLRLLGGREPRRVPRPVAVLALRAASAGARRAPRLSPYARRIEMTWLGQRQAPSWLTTHGWEPVSSPQDWVDIGAAPTADRSRHFGGSHE